MTEGMENPKWMLFLLFQILVGMILAVGTLWPFEFTSLLPASHQLKNWPIAFKVVAGFAAATCVIGDIWFLSVLPGLATSQKSDEHSGGET